MTVDEWTDRIVAALPLAPVWVCPLCGDCTHEEWLAIRRRFFREIVAVILEGMEHDGNPSDLPLS